MKIHRVFSKEKRKIVENEVGNIYEYHSKKFGMTRYCGTSKNPYFCWIDVLSSLGFMRRVRLHKRFHRDIDVVYAYVSTGRGGIQKVVFISKKDLYEFLDRSLNLYALDYKDGVCKGIMQALTNQEYLDKIKAGWKKVPVNADKIGISSLHLRHKLVAPDELTDNNTDKKQ